MRGDRDEEAEQTPKAQSWPPKGKKGAALLEHEATGCSV
jgi:hypothetical protein